MGNRLVSKLTGLGNFPVYVGSITKY